MSIISISSCYFRPKSHSAFFTSGSEITVLWHNVFSKYFCLLLPLCGRSVHSHFIFHFLPCTVLALLSFSMRVFVYIVVYVLFGFVSCLRLLSCDRYVPWKFSLEVTSAFVYWSLYVASSVLTETRRYFRAIPSFCFLSFLLASYFLVWTLACDFVFGYVFFFPLVCCCLLVLWLPLWLDNDLLIAPNR